MRRIALASLVSLGVLGPALAQPPPPPPTPEQRSCDLRSTRGYCIGMTVMTPGADTLATWCPAEGGTVIAICPDDDTIAWCVLPYADPFQMRTYHYAGTGPHRWTVDRARVACTAAGGELQLPPG